MRRLLATLGVVALLVDARVVEAEEHVVANEAVGLEVVLPAEDWRLKDLSADGVVVHVYTPSKDMVPRVTLMRFPGPALPEGLRTRAAQIERDPAVKRVRLEASDLAGRAGAAYEYTGPGVRTVERGFRHGARRIVVQVRASEADWEDPAKAAAYARVFDSARRLEASELPVLRVDRKTPAEVRAARAASRFEVWPYAVRDHDVRVDLWPQERRLRVSDLFTLEGTGAAVSEIHLLCTHVTVTGVFEGKTELPFSRRNERVVTIRLPAPLRKAERKVLRFEAESRPFAFDDDDAQVQEISVRGQVGPESSFSSHVLYYPIDLANDAPVRLAISVPDGYTAVSGGERKGSEKEGDRRVFRFAFADRSPRLLPLGFAAARYAEVSTRTASGLELAFFHLEGHEKEARQRLDVALESAALFERIMGALPWKRVAFCEVAPYRKEAGCSLPGQVLVSRGFFGDVADVDLRGAAIEGPKAMSLLLVADELSHQWNAYATALPNELAEGVSTFTNLLYLESKRGAEEYRAGLRLCAEAYLCASEEAEDVAVADPRLGESPMFRTAAFCKVPVVLDLLRQRLGDEAFFRAWKHAFTSLRGRRVDFEDFERAMSEGSGRDLRSFFDSWFFQAGHPAVRVSWKANASGGGTTSLALTLEQVQPGGLYALEVPLEIRLDGETLPRTVPIRLSARREEVILVVPAVPRAFRVDPGETIPLLRSEVVPAR